MIQKGIFGRILHMQVEMPQEGFIRLDQAGKPVIPQEWRLKDGVVPKLSLDLGIHLHMFIKYFTDEVPVNVVAKSESLGNFTEIIDNVNCLIEYTNNLTCGMWYGKIAIGKRNGLQIRIYGQKASAEWIQETPEVANIAFSTGKKCVVDRGSDGVEVCNQARYTRFKAGHPAGFIEAFANYYSDIADALYRYKKDNTLALKECFGIEEAHEGLKLLEAIQRSSLSKKWEKV
jgi:predicted dehydrogenase